MTREEILQVAKPILYNTEMVRAILDGRKTVTRRLVKPQPPTGAIVEYNENKGIYWSWWMDGDKHFAPKDGIKKSPYKPGQYLYVRETWNTSCANCEYECPTICSAPRYRYKADYDETEDKWRPSIHMPKEAARIFLKVADVRVERLQEITEEQAGKEGAIDNRGFIHSYDNIYDEIHTAKEHFKDIWDSTIKRQDLDKYGWEANPWVWVIEFERVEVDG